MEIVPFLMLPGFITVRSVDGEGYPDISSCKNIELTAKSSNDYKGFYISFGNVKEECSNN